MNKPSFNEWVITYRAGYDYQVWLDGDFLHIILRYEKKSLHRVMHVSLLFKSDLTWRQFMAHSLRTGRRILKPHLL